mgnify:CR=1 FL=1
MSLCLKQQETSYLPLDGSLKSLKSNPYKFAQRIKPYAWGEEGKQHSIVCDFSNKGHCIAPFTFQNVLS